MRMYSGVGKSMATPLSEPNEEILQHFLCSGPLIFYGARVAVFIFPGVVILFLTDEYIRGPGKLNCWTQFLDPQ